MDINVTYFILLLWVKYISHQEIYFNTIQNRGRKHCAPILTGLHVFKLYVHDKTFMECNNNRDCLYICAFSVQIFDFFFSMACTTEVRNCQNSLVLCVGIYLNFKSVNWKNLVCCWALHWHGRGPLCKKKTTTCFCMRKAKKIHTIKLEQKL